MCVDTVGSFYCRCKPGFRFDGRRNICRDVNECISTRFNKCDHICTNTKGDYKCNCNQNFILQEDGKSCKGNLKKKLVLKVVRGLKKSRSIKNQGLILKPSRL
jgi:hypothetical protein